MSEVRRRELCIKSRSCRNYISFVSVKGLYFDDIDLALKVFCTTLTNNALLRGY